MKPRKTIGDKNIVGQKVYSIRKAKNIKQRDLLAKLQTLGMDISATSLSRLEGQQRLVQDYEIVILAQALDIDITNLLDVEQ